jgi:C-terminal processing protease CtpA/Prc
VDVSVTRPARQLPSPVTSSLQQRYGSGGDSSSSSGPVGVIRLTSFNARALRDVSAALTQLQEQGATELVLDLRDNRYV